MYDHNSNEDLNWNTHYIAWSKLVVFYGVNSGEANNPTDPQINVWLMRQRNLKREGKLDIMKVQILSREGIDWAYGFEAKEEKAKKEKKPSKAAAEKVYTLLGENEKRSWVEIRDSSDEFALLCSRVDTDRKKERLTDELIAKLNTSGFIWDWKSFKRNRTWEMWFARLEEYAKQGNNPNMNRWNNTDQTLCNWVWTQRGNAKKGLITPEQITRLKELGVWLDQSEHAFDVAYAEIELWHCVHGTTALPADHEAYGKVVGLKKRYKAGDLNPNQKAKLDALGFNPDEGGLVFTMKSYVDDAVAYYDKHGSWEGICHHDKSLKQNLKLNKAKNNLSEEQIEALESRGFEWTERKAREGALVKAARLLEYKRAHGDFSKVQADPELQDAVNYIRSKYNREEMPTDEVALFESIGFPWKAERKLAA